MAKLRYMLYRAVGCSLALSLLGALAVAQQPQEARLAIDHAPFTRPQRRGVPLTIEATITSPAGIRKADVFCRAVGGGDFTALPMESVAENRYRTVVPDWMTAGQGIEYYITATDERGQSTSQGFVGFPLVVQFVGGQSPTQEERLKALQETLDVIRKNKEGTTRPPDATSPRYR
jgi:hypothetical protein